MYDFQVQSLALKKDQKAARKQIVEAHFANIPESKGKQTLQESLLPSLLKSLLELQSQAILLQSAIEQASPILHQIFPLNTSAGNVTNKPSELLTKIREVQLACYQLSVWGHYYGPIIT